MQSVANEMGTEKAFLHLLDSKNDVAFDVNVRMVLLEHKLELGYAALKKISKVLRILGLYLKMYQKPDKTVTGMEAM